MQAANTIEETHCLLHSHFPRYTSANSRGHMQLRHLFVDQYTSRLLGRSESPREMEQKVHNAHALWTLVLKPLWELPKKQCRVRLEEHITKFRFNFYKLLREQSRGLTKWKPYRDRPSSSLSPLAIAPLSGAVANNTNTAANKITPADNNTMSSDPDSDDGDGEGGKDITASEQADKPFAGMFSTHLKEKATRSARVSKQTRLQRGHWQEKSAEMTYEERQEYFKVKNQQVDEKALMSTQPEH
jgi:hypothetical protein